MGDPGETGKGSAAAIVPDRPPASDAVTTETPASDQPVSDQPGSDQPVSEPASDKPADTAPASLALSAADRLPRAAAKPRHPLLWTGLVLSLALLATILLWPATDQLPPIATARAEILEIEQRLAALAFPPGPIDGVADAQTETAIRDFQRAAGLVEDGAASPELLAELRALGE